VPRVVLPEGSRKTRLDVALSAALPDVSRATVQRWIAERRVQVDGAPARAKDAVQAGAVIDYEPGPLPTSSALPERDVVFEVVYEDEHLVVVDKPAGLVVHPGKGNWTGTLVNGLLARPGFGRPPADSRDPEGALRPGVVHRIDKDTSGLLVVAKTAPAREALKEQFAAHDIDRAYLALTLGVPRSGRIETLHSRHPTARLKFTSKTETGKIAVTHVEVLEAFQTRAAFVRCTLETGRTHQIRVHLAERCSTPLLADALYGRRAPDLGVSLERQALHAAVLGFVHPHTRERVRFESELPADLQLALDVLRASYPEAARR